MDNKAYEHIILELEKELTLLKSQAHDTFKLIESAIGLCNSRMIEVRKMVLNNGFNCEEDEISFFKYLKPRINSKLIFYIKLFDIEVKRRDASKEIQIRYLEEVLTGLYKYFQENKEFCQYYWRKQEYLDHIYFLREKSSMRIHSDNLLNLVDPDFSTTYDQTLAKIIAYERLVKYVENEIIKLKNNQGSIPNEELDNFRTNAHWSDTNTALVELVYALDSLKAVNNGHIEIKELIRIFETMFNVKLGDYYRIFKEIQKRKKDRTKFLNSLVEALNKRMYDLDE
ncbi:RteC domain-containing protein [uncultured Draconibacterium sp.]|uniref:RteC domain-containing protein n=1 Tax=uncultured Draconibacterium sp. TaxID=1573823 RepID=UPI002AA67ECE|nr:RteC domain-containing protein [uncultured Draconibacterium sp.]